MKPRILFSATIGVVILAGCGEPPPPAPQTSNDAQELRAFIDDFVSRQENEAPTDLSAASFAEELRQTKGLSGSPAFHR